MIAISKTCLKSLQNKNIWILTEEKLCLSIPPREATHFNAFEIWPHRIGISRDWWYFLLIYSKPCLVQLPRPYSFQKISWSPLDYLLWRRSGRFCQEFAWVEEITSLWPNSNIVLQVFISGVVTFIIYLLNTLYFTMKYIWNTAEIRSQLFLLTFHRAFSRNLLFHCWSKYLIYPYATVSLQYFKCISS
jgi:hypothetical protein